MTAHLNRSTSLTFHILMGSSIWFDTINLIVNFPFLDGNVPRSPFYSVYILQLICFGRACSNVDDFNNRNKFFDF